MYLHTINRLNGKKKPIWVYVSSPCIASVGPTVIIRIITSRHTFKKKDRMAKVKGTESNYNALREPYSIETRSHDPKELKSGHYDDRNGVAKWTCANHVDGKSRAKCNRIVSGYQRTNVLLSPALKLAFSDRAGAIGAHQLATTEEAADLREFLRSSPPSCDGIEAWVEACSNIIILNIVKSLKV